MHSRVWLMAAGFSIVLLSGCGTTPDQSQESPSALQALPVLPLGGGAEASMSIPAATHSATCVPGDVIDINVYDNADLNLVARVPESGSLTMPLVGTVEIAGRTPSDVERDLLERLGRNYLQNPQVTVTVREYAPRKVYVLGGIKTPAGYVLPPTERLTLLQLISAAGGYTERAFKEYVQIVRRVPGGKREVIAISLTDVEQALAKGRTEADLELQADDLIIIPTVARVVYVLGAVKTPGSFEIPSDSRMTASQAVSKAGSYTKFAATGGILILRQTPKGETQKIPVNLDDVLSGKLELDVELMPGDVVWVPERGIF